MRLVIVSFLLIACAINAQAQQVRLTGVVEDSLSVPLSSAHVFIQQQKRKTVTTNSKGEFFVDLTKGFFKLEITYTGYQKFSANLNISGDSTLRIVMRPKSEELEEVTITADRTLQSDQFQTTRMSTNSLTGKEISSIPVLGGEADVIKTIQLLPGVTKGADGTTDLFVRGGAADQNLVLLDGAPVYNTGHLFGFLSVFNPDILDKVESINGAFPAEYGGRLSSILDVTSRSSFPAKTQMKGNIGLLASRLMIEQPILKDKLSFTLAGRRTYVDQVVKLVGQELPYFFYDLNGKILYRPNANSRWEFTFYEGNDVLSFSNLPRASLRNRNITTDFILGNSTQTLRWDRSYRKFNSTLSLYRTVFQYSIRNTYQENSLFVTSRIEDVGGKWLVTSDSVHHRVSLTAGIEMIRHQVAPNRITTTGEISDILKSNSSLPQTSLESSLFIQGNASITKRLNASVGLRTSSAYVDQTFYYNFEPRFALRYKLDSVTALKFSFSRMSQYLHRVSSAAVAFPTDIWYPVTRNVKPQTADQVALGMQRTIPERNLFVSIEGYYKWMHQLIGYKEGASLLLNVDFEKQLVQGQGRAYGLEVLIKKESGKLTGWLSYTWAVAERQYDAVNGGQWFLARYDRRHNAALVLNYQLSKKWSLSSVFEFISGSRFTPIIGQYVVPSPTLVGLDLIPVYASANSVKLADTHRLDIGAKFRPHPNKRFQGEWFAGVYNVYHRASPIGIVIMPNGDGSFRYEQPGLFGLLPFVSYGFKF
jgi:hypothetical protein